MMKTFLVAAMSALVCALMSMVVLGNVQRAVAGPLIIVGSPVAPVDPLASIQTQLQTQFTPAQTTPDGKDIAAAGIVLILHKGNLVMNRVDTSPIATSNQYKGGTITQTGLFGGLDKLFSIRMANTAVTPPRAFAPGEKFWATQISTKPDRIIFQLMSDPINNVRYHATLSFPYANGSVPTAAQAAALVSEVFATEAFAAGPAADANGAPVPQQEPDATAPAPQAPPADTSTTGGPPVQIELGQSKDEVLTLMGQPTKIVKLSGKEIYYYPDMKVYFQHDKVSDVK